MYMEDISMREEEGKGTIRGKERGRGIKKNFFILTDMLLSNCIIHNGFSFNAGYPTVNKYRSHL